LAPRAVSGLLYNERSYRAVHVHKYRLSEVADFVGLNCSTMNIIPNRIAKARETPGIKACPQSPIVYLTSALPPPSKIQW